MKHTETAQELRIKIRERERTLSCVQPGSRIPLYLVEELEDWRTRLAMMNGECCLSERAMSLLCENADPTEPAPIEEVEEFMRSVQEG